MPMGIGPKSTSEPWFDAFFFVFGVRSVLDATIRVSSNVG